MANVVLLLLIGSLVINAARSDASQANAVTIVNNPESIEANPLDQVSSADIAVNVARTTGLVESVAVTNQSDSVRISTEIATTDTPVVTKPQVVSTALKSVADIQTYIVQPGDTIASIAAKFNVTSESIRWSNGLTGTSVRPGTQLNIPPINGIIYVVQAGDTAASIAQKYKTSEAAIIAFNDAEIAGLHAGQKIVIPNGQQPIAAPAFRAWYGYNTYDPGWCTYYASARGGAPGGWGNANTWAKYARLTPGWTVSSTPVPGAIAQTTRGSMGHVGVVDDVKVEGGVTYIRYSDMNGLAGFNRIGSSGWVPANSKFENFIYR